MAAKQEGRSYPNLLHMRDSSHPVSSGCENPERGESDYAAGSGGAVPNRAAVTVLVRKGVHMFTPLLRLLSDMDKAVGRCTLRKMGLRTK